MDEIKESCETKCISSCKCGEETKMHSHRDGKIVFFCQWCLGKNRPPEGEREEVGGPVNSVS
jgi:hypothetical protein